MSKDKRTAMVGTLVLALFLLSLTLTNPGKALAVDAFLKIDGVLGESTDAKHKDEIAVINWSFGETQSVTAALAGGGARSGRVTMQDFKFTMRTNKASPKLFQTCASGEHLQSALLTVRKADKNQSEFLQIWLSDVLVSSFVSLGSSGGTDPMEEIMLNFAKIKVSYKPTRADGSLDAAIEIRWDVQANKKF